MPAIDTTYSRRSEFWAGVRDTFPMVVGAIPFGIIFGAAAVNAGITTAGVMGLSGIVFAGSAQFMAANLWQNNASVIGIVLTTLVINLRHALYGATLSPYVKHLPQRWLLPLGFTLTDESFVIVATRYYRHDDSPYKHWYFLGSVVFMYCNWQTMTLIGILAGQAWGDRLARYGLDFALIVTFIGMMIPLVVTRPLLVAALVAGGSAVLLRGMPNNLWLLVASLLGIAAGMLAETLYPAPLGDAITPTRETAVQEVSANG